MSCDCSNPEDVLRTVTDDKIEMIDLRFTDIPGLWQHFSVPPNALDLDSMVEGIGFDGSSIRGFQEIQESDMLFVSRSNDLIPGPVRGGPDVGARRRPGRRIAGTSGTSPGRQRPISKVPGSAMSPVSARSSSISSSMRCATTTAPTMAIGSTP
jgi:Glutamine synthetase, beta-Grasp domain